MEPFAGTLDGMKAECRFSIKIKELAILVSHCCRRDVLVFILAEKLEASLEHLIDYAREVG